MKTLVFANEKGGVGKTTATCNLTVDLVNAGKQVLCMSIDEDGFWDYYVELLSKNVDKNP